MVKTGLIINLTEPQVFLRGPATVSPPLSFPLLRSSVMGASGGRGTRGGEAAQATCGFEPPGDKGWCLQWTERSQSKQRQRSRLTRSLLCSL